MSAEKKNKAVKGRLEELRRGLISRRESREGLPGRFPLNKGLKERWEQFPQARGEKHSGQREGKCSRNTVEARVVGTERGGGRIRRQRGQSGSARGVGEVRKTTGRSDVHLNRITQLCWNKWPVSWETRKSP